MDSVGFKETHEVKMENAGKTGKKWDARKTGYTFDQNTLYACMKFPGNLKKKKFRKGSTLIKSFLSHHGNCAATRISPKAYKFGVFYGRKGRIWEHCFL